MRDTIKNKENAQMADKIKIGDKVRVAMTGEVGTVTKKVEYDREHQHYFSPFGYTTIQVRFDNCKGHKRTRHFAARSLVIL